MTYRLRLSRPALKLRVNTRIPAQFNDGTGISITKANGVYTADLDYSDLGESLSFSDAFEATTYVAAWESSVDTWSRISVANIKTDFETTFAGLYQPLDSELTALSGLTSAADALPYFTGSATASLTTLTAFARTLLDDTTQAAMRTTLGLTPGTDVQAFDADLSALAANSTDGLWAHTGAGTGAARTLTAPAAGITITNPAGIAGNPTLVLVNDLAAVEGLASTGIARRTGTDAWSVGTAVSNAELATMVAYTIKANATGSSAVPTDVSIPALTQKASPVAADKIMIADSAASDALKYATVSSIASAGSVASVNGQTGALTLDIGRNRLINGRFEVDQRNSGATTSTADNSYFGDRWRFIGEASANCVAQDFNNVITGANNGAIIFTGTTDKGGAFQVIEGKNCKDLRGKTVTLSVALNVSNTRLGNIKVGILEWTGTEDATTGDPISAWGADGVTPTLAANWTFINTPANLSVGTTGAQITPVTVTLGSTFTNLAVMIWNDDKTYTANDALRFTNVQLEQSSAASPFEARPISQTLLNCQRYCQTWGNGGTIAFELFAPGYTSSTTNFYAQLIFPVKMRGTPTLTYTAANTFILGLALTVPTVIATSVASSSNASIAVTASGLTAGDGNALQANNTAVAKITVTAEI